MEFDKSRQHINAGGSPYIGDIFEIFVKSEHAVIFPKKFFVLR